MNRRPNLAINYPITQSPNLFAEVAGARADRFFRLHGVLHVTLQLELVVARLRRQRRRLVRRDLHVPVVLEPGASRNLLIDPLFSSLPYIKSGHLEPIAIMSPARSAIAPNVPTAGETLPGVSVESVFGAVVPSGTPHEVVNKISTDMKKVLQSPETRARVADIGLAPVGTTPEQFDAFIRAASDKRAAWPHWRQSNMKPFAVRSMGFSSASARRFPSLLTSGANSGASREKNTYRRRKPRAWRTDQRRTLYMAAPSSVRRRR